MNLAEKSAITINSLMLYLLAYFFVFIGHQAFTVLAAYIFSYPLQVNYTEIYFLVYKYAWTFDSVKIIYSAGPIFCVMLAIFMIVVAIRFREFDGLLKVFFQWGFVHSVSITLGSAVAGALLDEGFGHVLAWMYTPDTGKLIVTLIGIFGLAALGFALTRIFVLSANTYFNQLAFDKRRSFLFQQLLLPYMIGSAIIFGLRFPMDYYELFRMLIPVIVILPSFISGGGSSVLYFDEEPKTIKISSSLIAAAFSFILAYRIILNFPIKI